MAKIVKKYKFAFTTVFKQSRVPSSAKAHAFLCEDRWNDWEKFQTQFQLVVFDATGERHDLGDVKIGQFGLTGAKTSEAQPGKARIPAIPPHFETLDDTFFSLGQDEKYYEKLGQFDEDTRQSLVRGLQDVVANDALWRAALNEEVMSQSLLRFVKIKNVEEQFRRLLAGGARLSEYSFAYTQPTRDEGSGPPITLTFKVTPESLPPSNVHVVIGRNGVGKTYTLQLMTKALVKDTLPSTQSGLFMSSIFSDDPMPFSNLVSVSFSAFDNFDIVPENRDRARGLQYSYIGLRYTSNTPEEHSMAKTPEMLSKEFVSSVRICTTGGRAARWDRAVTMLEADPLFKEAEVKKALVDVENILGVFEEDASKLFKSLSSGHKIVLLTIARLVETVDEKTLVLLDEPEAHLHPPLLSAFIRALSELLIHRNGVAIVATHSPVVLQEVPKECVWKLRRTGHIVTADRPEIETFGENVGILTREVFGLEVVQSGFHKLLKEASSQNSTFEAATSQFGEKLGAEARAILRGLYISKDSDAQ